MEVDDLLWHPIKGTVERKRSGVGTVRYENDPYGFLLSSTQEAVNM